MKIRETGRRVCLCLLLLFAGLPAPAPASVFIPASHPHIAYIGRVSFKHPHAPCFTYPGVQIRALFEGTSLGVAMKPNSGYFMVEIDSLPPFKIEFGETDSVRTLICDLPGGLHEVRLTLAYEGYLRRPEFRGLILDEGKTLPAAPRLPERSIEFIGNSITCGYGLETDDPRAPFQDETENHFYTYAALTARAFDALSQVVARSGVGIYRNYNGPATGSADCLPARYTQTLWGDSTETWAFSRYRPDVVCVNLGTNDVSTGAYDTTLLEAAYRRFLHRLREYYPEAKIVLLSGCMLTGRRLQDVCRALDRVALEAAADGDGEVYRFDLTPTDGSLGYGASWHPSKAQQAKSALELIGFLQTLTGWEVVR